MNNQPKYTVLLNRDRLRDKIYACWLGKNLGGTIGAPYEATTDILDVKGFATNKGEVLANDDLDLQLVWLKAVDDHGIDSITSELLSEYWLSFVVAHWNEYGVSKTNMRQGLLPPMSGEFNNTQWKNSNGAWIRTEIWACLCPARPEKAIQCAFADASVDHGFGEGSYAAIFIAAIESAAFAVSDLDTLLDIGLSKIPADCRVAQDVRTVREMYAAGADWKEVRNRLVKDDEDLGWFQAPSNIGYVVIGLLYGGGDFKKSMLTAINCGDDTDCTAATVGSIMGIMGGTACLPEDWTQYLGESIVTGAILKGHGEYFPDSITQLTDCVMNLLPATLRYPLCQRRGPEHDGVAVILTDGEDDFSGMDFGSYYGTGFVDRTFCRSRFSVEKRTPFFTGILELDGKPVMHPLESLSGKVTLVMEESPHQSYFRLRWILPDGWKAEGDRNIFMPTYHQDKDDSMHASFTITAGETVEPVNTVVLEISVPDRPSCMYFTLRIFS